MKQQELAKILADHEKWLNDRMTGKRADLARADLTGADLAGANLAGANLTGADLAGANLAGADIDYSSWPLHCGSLGAIIDRRIFSQLAYHLCRVKVADDECKAAQAALKAIANTFHHVIECGIIE